MLSRLAGVLAFLVCMLFVAPAGARQELLPTLVFDSAEIDYSGVELLMRFKYTPPPAETHPYLSDTIMPELEDGNSTSYPLTRKGANFEVIENENEDEVLWWTLRYRIDSDPSVTYDQTGFTVSWWGGPLASTETGGPSTPPRQAQTSRSPTAAAWTRTGGRTCRCARERTCRPRA